jgi:hypothetical protein
LEDDLTFDFSFDVSGKIWQLSIDENGNQVGIEVRDEEEQELFFLVFDLNVIEVSDYLIVPGADWWTTIIALRSGLLILDKYQDPQDPTKKSLLIFDTKTQADPIEIDDFQFIRIDGERIIGTAASDKSQSREFGLDGLKLDGAGDGKNIAEYPVFAASGSEIFNLSLEYLNQKIEMGVEYFETNDDIIISYYVRSGAKFDRRLVVIQNGQEIAHFTQDIGLNGYASGAYFVMKGYLIFISNSNQINGIKI